MIAWNHKVRVYKDEEGRDEFGATSVLTAGSAPASKNARPDQNWSGDQQNVGGEVQGVKRRWFLRADVAVAERDILEVTDGPEAPVNLRVVSMIPVDGAQTTHHIEVNVERYTGELVTEEDAES